MRSPRRLVLVLLSISTLALVYLYFHTSPSHLFSTNADPSRLPEEIFGLLHFVTSPHETDRILVAPGDLAQGSASDAALESGARLASVVMPDEPVEMAWYALGAATKADNTRRKGQESPASGWTERLRVLREEYPLVVFSKSYCPYSKRAKRLLEIYDLSPPPKIIEVDLRGDAPHVKTLLTRLTHRSTFPNVILHGRSLGGSDELVRLHEGDRLRSVLEAGGLTVRWTGDGGEGVVL